MRRLFSALGKLHFAERPPRPRSSGLQLYCSSAKCGCDKNMDFASMKVVELREFLDSKGLPKTGNKQSLIDRAQSYWSHLNRHKVPATGQLGSENTEVQVEKQVVKLKAGGPPPPDEAAGSGVPPAPPIKEELPEMAQDETAQDEMAQQGKSGEEDVSSTLKDGNEATNGSPEAEQQSQMGEKVAEDVAGDPSIGEKRHRSPLPYPKKRKRRSANAIPKTPLQVLNELRPGLKFEVVDQDGPLFKAQVTVDEVLYFGIAPSKKGAKHTAAIKVLEALFPRPAPPPGLMHQIDFTSDSPLWESSGMFERQELPPPMEFLPGDGMVPVPFPLQHPVMGPTGASKSKSRSKTLANTPEDKHPVMVLNELCQGLQYTAPEPTNSKTFITKATIKGVEYSGEGKNKKSAKLALAIKALKEQFGIISRHLPEQLPVLGTDGEENGNAVDAGKIPDLMSDLVKKKFADLTDNLASPHATRKVLAGVVLTREKGPETSEGQVICVATGTKCISGGHISNSGSALNDCHAEVICRRGLRKYLFDQLLLYTSNKEESLFESCEGSNNGYKLKSDVFFHLYINTSPCGDSRIFSPHETERHQDNHPNRKARGLLRTKIEAGEGTIPVLQHDSQLSNGIQPWDSVIGGERLLTMSCSDKLARWNLLGVQGSLLSLFIEPVYFSSMILGSLYHSKHFSRGVYRRAKEALDARSDQLKKEKGESVEDVPVIKEPFKMHRPLLASVSAPETRKASKAPSFCFHWTFGDESYSILNTVTGKGEGGTSNLCKMAMFRLFHKLLAEESISPKVDIPTTAKNLSYDEMKNQATDYQELKEHLHAGFNAMGLGTWVKKPQEVDSFYLQDEGAESMEE